MQLVSFSVLEYQDVSLKDIKWAIREINFSHLNLLVGKNSAGKSRMVSALDRCVDIIMQKLSLDGISQVLVFHLEFKTKASNKIKYVFAISNNKVIYEILKYNDVIHLNRSTGTIYLLTLANADIKGAKPPVNILLMHSMRDTEKFPFFEEIIEWATNYKIFRFSHLHTYLGLVPLFNIYKSSENENASKLYSLLDDEKKLKVLEDINYLGFNLLEIEATDFSFSKENKMMLLSEQGLGFKINQLNISQGLYRAISLIIFLYYYSDNKCRTIVVDDLSEGLDYDRSTKLGKLLLEKFSDSNFQFISTTNDTYLMEVIDIKYWNIIHRKNNIVSSFNYNNCKKAFDNFYSSGLSNADLLSSNYLYDEYIKENEQN